ncbi:SH3 domain-containing protein [Pleurocapsa sp. PCC 7319]|uniref:SH3 domain-containing protein n=1 Tax=Pleurocapsa sp. PCC 7319 TaxID=118161 RepID=UPI00037B140B|nr:SH3 domain-containing protein [Pleurocapsa sp. PCC 7319]
MTKPIFLRRLSTTVQFILGFLLGIALIVGFSAGAIFLYYRKMSTLPEKPVFSKSPSSEELELNTSDSSAITEESLDTAIAKDEAKLAEKSTSATLEEEKQDEAAEVVSEPELPPNAYRAVVTWPQGLSLRAEPSNNAGRVGGVYFDDQIIILEDSADGQWQKVRVPGSNQEGWVKAGNTKRISEDESVDSDTSQDEEKLAAEPTTEEELELPANSYRAVVTWPQGLSLRAEPSINAGRVGGVYFDEQIIILENSADGQWQRVRVPGGNQEGWVRAGNAKRISY